MLLGLALAALPASAQQKIAYIDSEYIMSMVPEAASVQQQIDRTAQQWQDEIGKKQREVDDLFKEYQARELLYTNEERKRRREEIVQAEEEVERLRMQYFGPQGQLFTQQESAMRPVQEKILAAVEEVATSGGYDYIFDKKGDFLFLYAKDQLDLSDRVLEELGIEIDETMQRRGQTSMPSSSGSRRRP